MMRLLSLLLALCWQAAPTIAQGSGWQTGVDGSRETVLPKSRPSPPAAAQPQSSPRPDALSAGGGALSAVNLVALLTDDGQRIDKGLIWHVFQEGPATAEGRNPRHVTTLREASPTLRLAPGEYLVTVAFGRATLTRRLSLKAGPAGAEQFVLNAGGVRLSAMLPTGEATPPNSVSFDIYSDERDQAGNRIRVVGGLRPGLIIRLGSGIYHVVSTYGDANAIVRSDVTVEAGKLTEATVVHEAALVTLKLVARAGGEALPDTQWSIASPQGAPIKESMGALPTHLLAPGTYSAIARHGGRIYRRPFTVSAGQAVQVEVVMQ